jgi:hypothetical protein
MATDMSPNSPIAKLAQILAQMNTDIETDGAIDPASENYQQIGISSQNTNLPVIRSNLVNIYASLGLVITPSNFENYVDSDRDGDLQDDPVFTSSTSVNVSKNTTVTGYTATATDADGDTPTFSLTGGPDQSSFSIDATSGVLSFNVAPDFELPTDSDTDNTFDIEITASDGVNLTVQNVSITVTAINENPPIFTNSSASRAVNILENTTVTGYTAAATDADGDIPVFSLSGGADQASFNIGATSGVLSFKVAPDFGLPTDSDTDNTYDIEITASDGVNLTVQNASITVTDVFDFAVTSAGIKAIQFDWPNYNDATHYKLYVNPDGLSGFSLLQDNLTGTSTTVEIPVHLTDWISSRYILEAHNATGKIVESNPTDITALMPSAIGYFKASDAGSEDYFGRSLSIAADGNTLVVYGDAANNQEGSGSAYVFVREGNTWSEQVIIKDNGLSGARFSLSADGSTLAIGHSGENSVYVYTRSNSIWSQQATIQRPDGFGFSVDISADGNTLAGGSLSSNTVYVFTRGEDRWLEQATFQSDDIDPGDSFGSSIALSSDGNTLAAGAPGESSAAIGIGGDERNNGLSYAGAVYVFSRSANTWARQAYVKASNTGENDYFGDSVALSGDGNTLAVGAFGEASTAIGVDGDETINTADQAGAVYVFSRTSDAWVQQAYVKASNTGLNDSFGSSIDLNEDGNIMAVGAFNEDSNAAGVNNDESNNSFGDSGAAYTFIRTGITWFQKAYVKASNTDDSDRFGWSIGISADGSTMAVGAMDEESIAKGVNGDQNNNSSIKAGAVYLY